MTYSWIFLLILVLSLIISTRIALSDVISVPIEIVIWNGRLERLFDLFFDVVLGGSFGTGHAPVSIVMVEAPKYVETRVDDGVVVIIRVDEEVVWRLVVVSV